MDPPPTVPPLALVGGDEWRPGCEPIDARLLELAGTDVVTVLPTAAGRAAPNAVDWARRWFRGLGAQVDAVMAIDRDGTHDPALADQARQARLLYIGGGSPRHLLDCLRDSPLWRAVVEARADGLVLAGSSAGAMVLAPGWLSVVDVEVRPHHESGRDGRGDGAAVGIDGRTAALWDGAGWTGLGAGQVTVYGLASLAELRPPRL